MKKNFLLFILFVMLLSCGKDDLSWQDEIINIKKELVNHQRLIDALQANANITSIKQEQGKYTISFSNGQSITLSNGATPIITIGYNGNWFINGDDTGKPSCGADGKDGSTPTVDICDGYWYINGENTYRKAIGIDGVDGKDGVFIKEILYINNAIVFNFSDGSSQSCYLKQTISKDLIKGFQNSEGLFDKSFTFNIYNSGNISPLIVSAYSCYTSKSGKYPTIRFKVGSYSSMEYTFGDESLIINQWRVPPMMYNMPQIQVYVTIPDGVFLDIKSISSEYSLYKNNLDCGIRIDSHLGMLYYSGGNTKEAFDMAAICGYSSCIANPIKTKDGVFVCFHEGNKAKNKFGDEVRLTKDSIHSKTYEELLEYIIPNNYFKCKIPTLDDFLYVCAKTGMKPMFSTHPALSDEEWITVKTLLNKYNLLNKLTIKSNEIKIIESAYKQLGDIEGYIYYVGDTNAQKFCDQIKKATNGFQGRLGIEFYEPIITEDAVKTVLFNGLFASVWWLMNASGQRYKELMSWGVTEFCDDRNCSVGLNW